MRRSARESSRGLSASSERRRKPRPIWILRLALSPPYTFVVMGLVILLLGVFAIVTTPTDIFPEIDIPVVSVIWNYDGLTTEDMASRITTFSEYTISSAVNDVRSIESQTYPGVGVIKIYFQPNVNVEGALAQVTAVSQTILRRMPPGAVPPFILQYNASSVPIIQLALGGKTLSEAELYDYGIYRVRQQIAPIQGITLPLPYGGKPRQVMVDLDPQALLAKSISAADVSNAVNLQNLTLPSGTVKLGPQEYRVSLNSSPDAVAALNELPVKVVNGATVYLRDVAHVRDGFAVQTNIVRQDGRRSVLLTVIKKGGASTAPSRSRRPRSSPRCRSASSSSPSCSSPVPRSTCSRRWRWPWCSPCSRRICSRARSSPRSCATCWRARPTAPPSRRRRRASSPGSTTRFSNSSSSSA